MRPELRTRTTSESDLESVFSLKEAETSGKQTPKYKYVCDHPGCGQTFKRQVYLDRHEFKHTGVKKHICFHDGCNKAYTIITHLKRHINTTHEAVEKKRDVKCRFDFCDKLFTSVYNMERHIREIHENPKVYECIHCHEKFNQRIKLRRHEVKHTGVYPYNCAKCSKGFVQEYFFGQHICKSYVCEKCQAKFGKWSDLVAHHKATNHNKTIYTCEHCGKTFNGKFFYTNHLNIHEEDKEVYKCTYEGCSKFYSHKRSLVDHIRIVHEDKKFPCTFDGCTAVLARRRTLRNHMKIKHHKSVDRESGAQQKPRSKRKDAGKKKKSTLTRLSRVVLNRDVEQMILDGEVDIHIDRNIIQEEEKTNAEESAVESDAELEKFVILEMEKC